MLQISFLLVGSLILVLSLATILKKHARLILWTAAIILLVSTLFAVGLGVVEPIRDGVVNLTVVYGMFVFIITSGLIAYYAEKLHEKRLEQIAIQDEVMTTESKTIEDLLSENAGKVVLTNRLNTELAKQVFSKAIDAGYIDDCGTCYKWNASKVLLAYICGRIYCGDVPKSSSYDEKPSWKFGNKGVFPDSELNVLFKVSDIGQSRLNRKDLPVPSKSLEIDNFFE